MLHWSFQCSFFLPFQVDAIPKGSAGGSINDFECSVASFLSGFGAITYRTYSTGSAGVVSYHFISSLSLSRFSS